MRNHFLLIPMSGLLLGGLALATTASEGEQSISDREIGLSKESVLETPSPERVLDDLADPGETPLPPRFYAGSPPQIPHAIADMLPITRRENLCVDCHHIEESSEGEPTPIPEDHFIDYRNAPTETRETISGARHNCTTCHVRRTKNEPLVGNRFQGPATPAGGADSP